MIAKLDMVPAKSQEYYQRMPVKPGFGFYRALMVYGGSKLCDLGINIPDTIYVNFNAYLLTCKPPEEKARKPKIEVVKATDPQDFLKVIKERSAYNLDLYWNQPTTVFKKATTNDCYTTSVLMNWKQTKSKVFEKGLNNLQMVQRFIRSFGDRQSTYRLVLFPADPWRLIKTTSKKEPGTMHKNHIFQMINKTNFKEHVNQKTEMGPPP